jgi:ABC-type amino acid transport system permease subunit
MTTTTPQNGGRSMLLSLLHVFGGRLVRSAIVGYLFLIRGIPLLVLLTFVYYLMPAIEVSAK